MEMNDTGDQSFDYLASWNLDWKDLLEVVWYLLAPGMGARMSGLGRYFISSNASKR